MIPGLGRTPGEGNGNPLQYSCLENPMDRGARLQSIGSQRVRHNRATNTFTFSLHSDFLSIIQALGRQRRRAWVISDRFNRKAKLGKRARKFRQGRLKQQGSSKGFRRFRRWQEDRDGQGVVPMRPMRTRVAGATEANGGWGVEGVTMMQTEQY